LNIVNYFILNKKIKKNFILYYFFYNYKKNNIIKFNLIFFFNFFFKYLYLLNKIYNFKKIILFAYLIMLNLKNKQPRINFLNINYNKINVYSIGLVLKILNLYKKSNRRNIIFLKYVLNYIFKLYFNNLLDKKIILVFKGFFKNYLKLVYYFKYMITKFKISLFLLLPITQNNKI
jgi:hypothetical protein